MISFIKSLFEYSIDDKILWDIDRLYFIESKLPEKKYKELQEIRNILKNGIDDEDLIEAYNKLKKMEHEEDDDYQIKCSYRLYMAILQLKLKNYRKAKEHCERAKTHLNSDPEATELIVYIEECEKEANRAQRFRPGTKKAFAAASIVACIAVASLVHYIFSRRRL